jgi:beta-glucanase (GH16 family)
MLAPALVMLLAVPAADSTLPEPPAGSRWEAVPELSDEFDGSALDPKKWQPRQPYWKGREPSRFDTANVSVEGGFLRLRSTTAIDDLATVKDPTKDVWVTAACVASLGPIAREGYYEARFKASDLPMTSSFWFQGKYSEIDVVEQVGHSAKNPGKGKLMLMNTHYFRDGWKGDRATPKEWTMPAGAAEAYHVYGVWWKDEHTVRLFHDGQPVAEMTTGGAFDEPQYLFFDTEVFLWEGLPDIAALKDPARNTMTVDWVRAWKLVPADR